ncbi:NPP1-like protein [Phytophthora palmivora]|uniref:NPP1-like protein n=1 Tax=Phytophthora palmivora TaxID=4796 RepID=A0A2P4Y5P7_9STRA|nr:NPP1-like protein [Phytophthora palmivora]
MTNDKNSVTAPEGFQLGGFFGRDGDEIDSIGAIWTSIALVTAPPNATPAPWVEKTMGHDGVVPFKQPEPVTISEKAAIKFKPQLHISNGCHAYPAVNLAGETSGGLKTSGAPSAGCKGSGWGSQVYGRSTWFNGVWAIMYSWYFPKDSPSTGLGHRHDWEHVIVWIDNPDVAEPKILAVTPSAHSGYSAQVPPDADKVDGNSVKVNYESSWPINHALESTTKGGDYQDLIMWGQLSEAARQGLQNTNFGSANVPMKDGNFEGKLDKAWPFGKKA